MDEKHRERLDDVIADARRMLIKENKWTVDSEELKTDEFLKKWRVRARELLVEDEHRRRKQQRAAMQEEGREQKKQEEEAEVRKRKRQHEEDWEATREQRIDSWRQFQKGKGEGKKKKKMKVLG
jgi:DnaJ family protein C protein 8